jgi:hypothetical protein
MAQASRPMRRLRAQIKCHRAKGFFACADGEEILVKPRVIMVVEKSPYPLHAMPPHQKVPTIGIAHQRGNTGLVDGNFDGFETA